MTPALIMALTIAAVAAMAIGAIVVRRLDVIHVLVNSNLTQVKRDLGSALTEIGELREQLGKADQKVEEAQEDTEAEA